MHIGVIFHQFVGTVSQLIAMQFGKLIELIYVINFAMFGVDRSQNPHSGEQSNTRVLPLLEKRSLTRHIGLTLTCMLWYSTKCIV